MKKIMFKKISTVLILFCLFIFLPSSVSASKALDQAKKAADGAYQVSGTDENTIINFSSSAIGVIFTLLGSVFVILMVYGGIIWMTSAGNTERVSKAQQIMLAALIGLVVVMLAYAITYFVVKKFGEDTNLITMGDANKLI